MSDYLLLTHKVECPACRRHSVPKYLPGVCRTCGMRLFDASNGFKRFEEETGWREYWVWCGYEEGWKHRSQVFNPEPLHRVYKAPELESDYGTEQFQNRKLKEASSRVHFHHH